MSIERWIFTVSPGRSGQGSLAAFLAAHVERAYVAFEEPQVRPHLPGALGDLERRFRRRFVETDEMLGRGRILLADANGDQGYIDRIVAQRLRVIARDAGRAGARTYIDVNSHFVRGLCWGFARALPRLSLIRLLRDPLLVMRSYLNRRKSFAKEYAPPDAPHNLLRLDPANLAPGELYLWAWCESYLRFERLAALPAVEAAVELRTDALNDAAAMDRFMDGLGLAHAPARPLARHNTNLDQGYGETRVTPDDVRLLARFLDRLPAETRARLRYFDGYAPPAIAELAS
ncbi:MAG: hypothetical protein AB7P52_08660 [Alphaproteobacteria bacterium]